MKKNASCNLVELKRKCIIYICIFIPDNDCKSNENILEVVVMETALPLKCTI